MAAIKINSFLILERTLTRRLRKTWRKTSPTLFLRIQKAIAVEDWTRVEVLIGSVNFGKVLASNRKFMEFIGRGAFLFGVARHGELKESSFVKDKEKIPFLKETSQNLQSVIAQQGTLQIQSNIRRAVAIIKGRIDESKITKAAKVRTNTQLLRNAIDGQTDQYLETVSSLHNSRLAGWGYVKEAEALGVTTYAISEQIDSDSICPICLTMHGKTFQVREVADRLERLLTIDNLNDLKHVAPFPRQNKAAVQKFRNLSNSELVSNGWQVPPFHPRCRGILVRTTDAVNLGPLPDKNARRIPDPQPIPVIEAPVQRIRGLDQVDSDEVRRLFPSLIDRPAQARRALVRQRSKEQALTALAFADEERLAKRLRGRSAAVRARITGEFKPISTDPTAIATLDTLADNYADANMNPAVLRQAPLKRLAMGAENRPRTASRFRLGRYDYSTNGKIRDLFILKTDDINTYRHEFGHHFDYVYTGAIKGHTARSGTSRQLRSLVGLSEPVVESISGVHTEYKNALKLARAKVKNGLGNKLNVKSNLHLRFIDQEGISITKSPSAYALTNDREWIAESSALYYSGKLGRKTLKENAPKTFQYIDDLNAGKFLPETEL